MAGGRDCYSLETRAHRDNYRIKDVDGGDGLEWGEQRWKNEGVPEVLYVGWDEADVLARWEGGVKKGLAERGFLGRAEMERARESQQQQAAISLARGGPGPSQTTLMWGTSNVPASTTKADEHRRKSTVKLSADAGRFLCEYALFESLSRRWLDARTVRSAGTVPSSTASLSESAAGNSNTCPNSTQDLDHGRLGKVAFLHVPGWTGVEDINRGVMVAEEAIRALVGSWEDGYRRHGRVEAMAYTQQHSEERGKAAATWRA